MEKFSNIPKPSSSRLPILSRKSPDRNLVVSKPRKVLRRSKSVSDLKPINGLKQHDIFVRPLPRTLERWESTSTSSLVQSKGKRPADPIKPPVKAKVAKNAVPEQKENIKSVAPKQRIPPYDYKARFNALTEKFEKFKTLHKDCKEIGSLYDRLKSEHEVASQKLEKLEPEFKVASAQLDMYKKDFRIIKEKYEYLVSENAVLKSENAVLKPENAEQLTKIRDLTAIVELQTKKIQESDRERRVLHNMVQELKGNIRVFCRVRPPLSSEGNRILCDITYGSDRLEIRDLRTSNVGMRPNSQFTMQEYIYDAVFSPETTQQSIFEELDLLVQSALDGYHICVFAYGQTGSGKTYTMNGNDSIEGRGMIPRTVESLFKRIADLQLSGWKYEIQASFLEIYNESIKDLLDPLSKLPHDIRHNDGKGATVTNLQIRAINSEAQLQQLIKEADQNRSVAVTNYNDHSSRSHAVTKIYLQGIHDGMKTVLEGTINLVDLAGSENAKRSGDKNMSETKHINKSLAALGNVMLALHNGNSHIPYRDSKLTYLLGSCLGGNSKTLMFLNISPFEDCYVESVNALRFAANVKDVKTNFRKNKTVL